MLSLSLLALCSLGLAQPEYIPPAPSSVVRLSESFVSVYVLMGDDGVVLVDAHNAGSEDWILEELAKIGVQPSEVKLIVLTHGHPDHAGSAAALKAATGAPIAVGAGDATMVQEGPQGDIRAEATDLRGRVLARLLKPDFEHFTPDILITDALDLREYGVEATAQVVGGHTSGSVVVTLDETGQVLIGDLVRGGMLRRHKVTLHFFQEDPDTANFALEALLDAGATELCAAHDRCLEPERVRRWLKRREA